VQLDFNLLFPTLPIPDGDQYKHVSTLLFQKAYAADVFRAFEEAGIRTSAGINPTKVSVDDCVGNCDWCMIDCWIGHNGYRDIIVGGTRKPEFSQKERRYALEDAVLHLEKAIPLNLDFVFS